MVAYLPALIGLVAVAAGIAYCARNTSGHSAFDPRTTAIIFIPVFLLGFAYWFRPDRGLSLLTMAVAILGAGFGFFVHHLGIMQPYDYWATHGLQPRNSLTGWLLGLYAGLATILLALSIRGCGKKTADRQSGPPDSG